MQGAVLLDVVDTTAAPIFKLPAFPRRSIAVIRRDDVLIWNLGLDLVYRVAGIDFQSDALAGQSILITAAMRKPTGQVRPSAAEMLVSFTRWMTSK